MATRYQQATKLEQEITAFCDMIKDDIVDRTAETSALLSAIQDLRARLPAQDGWYYYGTDGGGHYMLSGEPLCGIGDAINATVLARAPKLDKIKPCHMCLSEITDVYKNLKQSS